MIKALTIYVDDDDKLTSLCGAFICSDKMSNSYSSVSMFNEVIPDDAEGLYIPRRPVSKHANWIRTGEKRAEEVKE